MDKHKPLFRTKRRKVRRAFLWIFLVFCLVYYLYAGGYGSSYIVNPLKRLVYPVPEFSHIAFLHNGKKKRIENGRTLHVRPHDTLKIADISTGIPFNRGVRLFSSGFDINALKGKMTVAKLLPEKGIYHHYSFQVNIKYDNRSIGKVHLVISPSVEGILQKANTIIDTEKKLSFLETAVREMPGEFELKKKLAQEYMDIGKWNKGARILEEMINKKEDPEFLSKLAEAYEKLRQYDKLIGIFRKILKNDPENTELRLRLAEILERKKRYEEAAGEYMKLISEFSGRHRISIIKNIGYLLFQAGKKKEALDCYLKAAEHDKQDPNLYYNIGSIYDELNRPEMAERYLGIAIELKDDDVAGRLRLGRSYFEKGDLGKAEKYAEEVLQKEPGNVQALVLLANILEKEDKNEPLRHIYERILAIEPGNTTILFNLGVLELDAGNTDKALDYLKKVVNIDPKDAQARDYLFDIYQSLNREELAFDQAVALIDLYPQKIEYYRYIFDYLVKGQKYFKLSKFMQKGVKANPKNFELRENLILAYLESDNKGLAVKEMEEALKLRPNDADLLFDLAEIKEEMGKPEEALKLYKKVIEIAPENEKAQSAYLRLRLELLGKER